MESYSYCALCLPSGRAEALLTADRYAHVKYHLELDKQRDVRKVTRSGRIVRSSNIHRSSDFTPPNVDENFDEREFLEIWKACYGRTDLQKSIRQEELKESQQLFKV